ncbi:MAG: hypothetical protein JWN72_1007 [Thermoleophilia bacterium]|nr:hypothetical protein [Thermoleophilia bacterium]
MEIRSAQAMPAGWDIPAKSGGSAPADVAPTPPPPAPPATAAVTFAAVLLAKQATEAPAEVLPPQRPINTFRENASVHPLASAAGRYPLVGKMLEDVFGLDVSPGSLDRAAQGIDLAA